MMQHADLNLEIKRLSIVSGQEVSGKEHLMTSSLRCTWLSAVAGLALSAVAEGATLYVAPDGNDRWSGTLAAPNADRTDGPLASLVGARDAVRRRRASQPGAPVTVLFRGGVYPILKPVVFTPQDSGTQSAPVRYAAYKGETPVLWGGRKIEGWRAEGKGLYSVDLPQVKAGRWTFRQLFANNQRQTRARSPNVDPADPIRRGFFYVAADAGGFGCTVGCIHNPGDWMKYNVHVPADGQYVFWMRYGAQNARTEWKTFDMAGRTVLTVDGGKPIPLADLRDTGGWGPSRWSRSATVTLTQGQARAGVEERGRRRTEPGRLRAVRRSGLEAGRHQAAQAC